MDLTENDLTRGPAEILAEYQRVCAELGDLTYKRDTAIPMRIEELKQRALTLNQEHAAAVAAQSKETKANG